MTTLFQQFQGADLDRLVECIRAIRGAQLSVDEHTQAGVNENSGNVWVWDEAWPGCVACSIDFRVSWWYSCPDCGEEHEFSTYADMKDYAEEYRGRCSVCTREG